MKIEDIVNLELFLVTIAVSIGVIYVTSDMKIILRKNIWTIHMDTLKNGLSILLGIMFVYFLLTKCMKAPYILTNN